MLPVFSDEDPELFYYPTNYPRVIHPSMREFCYILLLQFMRISGKAGSCDSILIIDHPPIYEKSCVHLFNAVCSCF